MTQQVQDKRKRDIPLWTGIALVVVGLGIASWFIWSQVSGFWSGPSGVFTIQGVDPAAVRPQPGPQRRQPLAQRQPVVRQINETSWRARSGLFSLTVRKEGDALRMSILAGSAQLLPNDAQWVMMSRGRLNAQAIKDIGLTKEQATQFRALPAAMTINLNATPEQLKQLNDLLTKYIAVPAAERDVVDRLIGAELDKVGKSLLPGAKTSMQEQYNSFRKTVTDAQWEKLKALATAPAAAPAATPATAPATK
jgi:hypothetical protein